MITKVEKDDISIEVEHDEGWSGAAQIVFDHEGGQVSAVVPGELLLALAREIVEGEKIRVAALVGLAENVRKCPHCPGCAALARDVLELLDMVDEKDRGRQ